MGCSILISTYGSEEWRELAMTRAYPSAVDQGAREVLVLHEPDATIAEVRNQNAARAQGEFLLHLDADDELARPYLRAMQRAYEQGMAGAAHAAADGKPPLLTPAVQRVVKGRDRGAPSFWDRGISLRDDNWLVVGTLIHRGLFMEVGGFSDYPHGFEDWSLWSKAYRAGAEVIKVPGAVYRYWINPESKHKLGWKDRRWQVATHQRVAQELDEWELARA